jgi:hypothetical protein
VLWKRTPKGVYTYALLFTWCSGRKITQEGQRDLDRIAGRALKAANRS